jgi:hypothetical protein
MEQWLQFRADLHDTPDQFAQFIASKPAAIRGVKPKIAAIMPIAHRISDVRNVLFAAPFRSDVLMASPTEAQVPQPIGPQA